MMGAFHSYPFRTAMTDFPGFLESTLERVFGFTVSQMCMSLLVKNVGVAVKRF